MIGDTNPYAPPAADIAVVHQTPEGSASFPTKPYKTIWSAPRKTLAGLIQHRPEYHINRLIILGGMSSAFSEQEGAVEGLSALVILPGLIIGGIIGAFIHKFVGGWLFRVVGGWLGGEATSGSLHTVIAWSYAPMALALPITLVFWMLSIVPSLSDHVVVNSVVWGVLLVIMVIVAIFSLVISVAGIAEAHHFSLWKGFFTLLLSAFVAFAVMMVVAFGVAAIIAAFR